MMSFIPILAILGLVVVARFLLTRLSAWTPKRTWIFVGGYIALGIIAFLSLPFIADNKVKIMSEQEITVLKQQVDETNTYAANNEWENIDKVYKKDAFTFVTRSSTFDLKFDTFSTNTYVYVTWADRESNEIQATYYELPMISSGINVTNDLPATNIAFANDVLTIKESETELTYYTMQPKLTMVENYIETFNYEGALHHYFIGNRILHLNVPKHITIMDESGWLQYLYN